MKVGVFLDEYIPQDGGAHTFQNEVFEVLLKLSSESQHDFVIISANPKEIAQKIVDSSLDYLPLRQAGLFEKAVAFLARNWPNFRNFFHWTSSFEKRAREQGIEFLWFLSPRPKEIDLPYMTIVYDLEHRMEPWFPELSRWGMWDIRERGYSRHLPRAYAIITGTEAGKRQIKTFYQIAEERIHILPHPTPSFVLLEKEKQTADLPQHLNLSEGYLLYPAQFWAHKNHMNLLLALKHLKEDHNLTLSLVLVGSDFGNRDYIEEQIKELGLDEQVHILGFVEQSELIALYQHALALTYVTFFGPENLPPLEAMALGCPVIATDVIGAEEQLGDAALLVDPAKPEEIAAAIAKLAKHQKLRDKMIARGRKRAARWTVEDFVRGAFKILNDFEPIRRVWRD